MDPTKQLKRVIENNIVLQNYTANNYRIILELIGIDLSIFTFRSRDTFPTTRGHHYKIFKYSVHYNARANFLTCRIANMWNNLSSEIIEAPSLNCCKSLLDS